MGAGRGKGLPCLCPACSGPLAERDSQAGARVLHGFVPKTHSPAPRNHEWCIVGDFPSSGPEAVRDWTRAALEESALKVELGRRSALRSLL